jgi:hypothetical protein
MAPGLRPLIALCLASVASLAQAEAPDEFTRPGPAVLRLALDSPTTPTRPSGAVGAAAPAPFQPPWLSGSDVHKYLGLGTLLAVGLTAASAPGEGCDKNCSASTKPRQTSGSTHTRAARSAAALAGATVATGLLVHWDDFDLQDGIRDPDNQHVLLGLIGSGLMLYAVNKSMKSAVPTQHSAYAELGGMAMAVAVKLTW